jgi:hypothetical protein
MPRRLMQAGEDDVLLVAACLVGTDYNPDGLKGLGQVKALDAVQSMLTAWRASGHSDGDAGFVAYAVECMRHGSAENEELLASTKGQAIKTFLRKAADQSSEILVSMGQSFASEVEAVAAAFRKQRHQAMQAVAGIQRKSLYWTGAGLNHVELIQKLEGSGLVHHIKSGANEVFQKVMHLEAERMARNGSSGASDAILVVREIKKVREWRNGAGIEDAGRQVRSLYILSWPVQEPWHACQWQ